MIKNTLHDIWQSGKPVLHGWLSMGNAFSAEVMAEQGFDAISVDVQHGALDYSDLLPMFQAMRASGVVIGARVPWLDPAMIMKVLDAGALQVICPMINSGHQAAEFVRYLRYPPLGERSFGPTRAQYALGGNIAGEANDQIIAWAMVETKEAFDNLGDIVGTPGIDGVYVGPADLTFSMFEGTRPPGFDKEEADFIDALKHIITTCHAHGKKAALHCGSAAYAARAVGWGFDMVTVSSDARFMAQAAAQSVQEFRSLTASAHNAPTQKDGY